MSQNVSFCSNLNYSLTTARYLQSSQKFVSVMREPVERVLSEYKSWKHLCNSKKTTDQLWTSKLCTIAQLNNLTEWIMHVDNTAHNRQFKTLIYNKNITISPDRNCLNMDPLRDVRVWKDFLVDTQMSEIKMETVVATALKLLHNMYAFIGLADNIEQSSRLMTYSARWEILVSFRGYF